MQNKCVFCGNKHLSETHTRYVYQQKKSMMFVDGVPCLECDYCREQYFDVLVLKKIEKDFIEIENKQKTPQHIMHVAVEEYALL